MFKSILISIAIAPLLLGVIAAKGRNAQREMGALTVGWLAYVVLWFGALCYLRYR